jgi:hypothetical protein
MARLTGLEPATPGVTGRYSNQLSYNRAFLIHVRAGGWLARLTGLEPATPGVTGRYSNQLSYNRVCHPGPPERVGVLRWGAGGVKRPMLFFRPLGQEYFQAVGKGRFLAINARGLTHKHARLSAVTAASPLQLGPWRAHQLLAPWQGCSQQVTLMQTLGQGNDEHRRASLTVFDIRGNGGS